MIPSSLAFWYAIEYLDSNYGDSAQALSRMTGYQLQRASTLAAACAQVGYRETMQTAAREFERLSREVPIYPLKRNSSDWTTFWRRAYPYLRDQDFERILDGIRKAQLPS